MADALDVQIEAYHRLLPEIRRTYGSAWVLVARETLVKTFTDFATAAEYALDRYRDEQILIRHTDERIESAPFLLLQAWMRGRRRPKQQSPCQIVPISFSL